MTRVAALLLALLVQAALVTTASAAPASPSRADTSPRDYIVAFKSSADADGETTALERKFGFVSKFRYAAGAERLRRSPHARGRRRGGPPAVRRGSRARWDRHDLRRPDGGRRQRSRPGIRRMGGAVQQRRPRPRRASRSP